MKTNAHLHPLPLPTFWALCEVDSVYNNGRNVSLTVKRILGKKFESLNHEFKGLTPYFDYSDDPQANGAILCREISLKETESNFWRIEFGGILKHRLLKSDSIAVLMSFNKDRKEGNAGLGFEIIGWNYEHIFNPLYSQLKHNIGKARYEREVRSRMAETHRNLPVRLVYDGKVVVTDTLVNLCTWFEFRAWPEGIELHANNQGRYEKMDLAMLPAPKSITPPRPDFNRNKMLVQMFESVKDLPQSTAENHEDDSAVPKEGQRHKNRLPNRNERRKETQKPPQPNLVSLETVLTAHEKSVSAPAQPKIPAHVAKKITRAHQRAAAKGETTSVPVAAAR